VDEKYLRKNTLKYLAFKEEPLAGICKKCALDSSWEEREKQKSPRNTRSHSRSK